jgi:hypothetical protein
MCHHFIHIFRKPPPSQKAFRIHPIGNRPQKQLRLSQCNRDLDLSGRISRLIMFGDIMVKIILIFPIVIIDVG